MLNRLLNVSDTGLPILSIKHFLLVTVLSSCFTVSMANQPVNNDNRKDSNFPVLIIEADWLQKHFSDKNIAVVDVRLQADYEREHIAGAVNIPVEKTFSGPPGEGLVAPISTIRKLFSNSGIDGKTAVVIYDDGSYFDAARVFWVLEVYGHKKVGLLNGGIALWKQKGLPVNNKPAHINAKNFIPTVVPENLSTKFSTRLAIDDNSKIIIDARSEEEYQGNRSITRRAGHIPTAINIPSSKNYINEDGIRKIKPVNQLKALYAKLDSNKKVIAYCNKGKESALTYFVLRKLGYNVSTYDGSWYEWSSDPALPIILPASKANIQ